MQVPPGMSVGRSLRLKGKGWPLKEGLRGDLLLSPVLKLPENLSDQERRLLEQLRQARSADPRQGGSATPSYEPGNSVDDFKSETLRK